MNTIKNFFKELITFAAKLFMSVGGVCEVVSAKATEVAFSGWDNKSDLARYMPYILVALYFFFPEFLFGTIFLIGLTLLIALIAAVSSLVIYAILGDIFNLAFGNKYQTA